MKVGMLPLIMSTCVSLALCSVTANGRSQLLSFRLRPPLSFTDVGPAKLETMIAKSDSILLARVTGTTRLRSGATIANAHVERTLKGPTFETVFYQVDLRMLEDVSTAHVGEKVLLFLYRPTLRSPDRYPKEIKRVTGGSPLFMIYHLGRGRLVTLTSGNKEYLQFRRGSPIILPEEIPVTWGFEASDPDLGNVGLEDFMKYIVKQTTKPALLETRRVRCSETWTTVGEAVGGNDVAPRRSYGYSKLSLSKCRPQSPL